MKTIFYSLLLVVFLASCQAKSEQVDDAQSGMTAPSLNDVQPGDASPNASLKRVVNNLEEANDSTETDSLTIGCYDWANTYLATTMVEDEESDQFELYTAITLKDEEKGEYIGTIQIYLSGCEEQKFEGSVKAKAERNYVTVFFDEDIDGMEDMFKKGDKLVRFEISYGEYVASWYQAMNDYVDEYTILSLQNH